jgi:hypothetical protein
MDWICSMHRGHEKFVQDFSGRRCSWEDKVGMDPKEIGCKCEDCFHLA